MLIGQIHASRKIRLVDAPEPKLEAPGQIIFQPEIGCLCGSDLPYFEADYPEYPPLPQHSLHEMIGSVVDTNGSKFRQGDRVLCVPVNQLGLAERYAVSEERALPLDKRVPEEHALLAQPLGTAIWAVKKLPNLIDLDVVVMGQGPMGQFFNACVRNMGARHIIGVDLLESRLRTSPKMGANATIDASREDVPARVREITDGAMADVVIEAVGHRHHAFNQCIPLCKRSGRILLFGVMADTVDGLRLRDLMVQNITVHASIHPDFVRDFPLAMRWVGERRIDVAPLITHRFPLAKIQEAFDTFHQRRDGAIKVLIDFPAGKRE